ncbi:MAG: GldG family protein, partial [Planctomycetia bacterium]|nr:GldG family protein [Planctomycetia bacterium]
TLLGSTKKVVAELDKKRPIHIEAFVSPNPPKEFVPLRLDLITRLREIAAQAGSNVSLRINETQPFTEEADRAEKLYGITGREIDSLVRGQYTKDTVFLGVAITSGLDKIVIPFVESSTPIEYEVMRSIATLNGSTRKRLGIFIGDKTTFQEFDPETRQPRDPEIVRELRKQYDVVDLDAEKPVPDNIDVLMAIQPTLWRPSQLDQLVTAVRRGVPTLIFQDPLPVDYPQMLQQEQQANGGMPFIQDSETKKLWDLLGVESGSQQIVTHEYNPLQHVQQFPPGYVFIGNGALGKNNAKQSLFDEKDPISANTEAVVFIFGGWVSKKKDATLTFTPLVHTSTSSGYVDRAEMFTQTMLGQTLNPNVPRHKTGLEYAMVARIQGTAPAEAKTDVNIKRLADEQPTTGGAASKGVAKNELLLAQAPAASPTATASATARPAATGPSATDPAAAATPSATAPVAIPAATAPLSPVGSPSPTGVPATIVNPYVVPVATASSTPTATGTAAPAGTATAAAPKKDRPMDVVIITDLDFMGYQFFRLRNQRPTSVDRVPNFDNITIVLNALDSLAGDNRFIEVRNRRPHHRTLTTLDAINMRSADDRNKQKVDKNEQMEEEYKKEDARLEEEYKKLVANTTLFPAIDRLGGLFQPSGG